MSLSDLTALSTTTVGRQPGGPTRRQSLGGRGLLQVGAAALLITWLVQSGALRWPSIARMFASPGLVAIALGFVIANYALLAMRLTAIVRAAGGRLGLWVAMRFTLAAAFAGWLIPGGLGSDLTKAYLLGRAMNGDSARGIGIATLDRVLGLAALTALAVAGQLVAIETVWPRPVLRAMFLACAALLAGFGVLFAVGVMLSGRICSRVVVETGGPFGVLKRVLNSIAEAGRRPGLAAAAFGWSLVAQASIVAAAVVVCIALNGAMPNLVTCALVPVGLVANALPLSPGGLGVGETVFETLFTLAGTSGGAETALSWRAIAVVGSLPGLLYLVSWAWRRRSLRLTGPMHIPG